MSKTDYDKKWLNNQLSEEELKSFEKTEEYHFLVKLDDAIQHFKAPDFDLAKEETKLNNKLSQNTARVVNWPVKLISIAASVLVVVGAWLTFFNEDKASPTTVSSADQSSLYLPDSSFVLLNKQTALTYGDWGDSREVHLKGEAFFEVVKGSTFNVVTPLGVVSVVGTKFNVEVWDDFFAVSCYEGTVNVVTEDIEIQLNRDQTWQSFDGFKQSGQNTLGKVPDWQIGESQFESIPLKYVLKEFERQYQVLIRTKDVNLEQRFTGAFTHDNINLALKSISLPLNLSYQLEEKQVQITGNH